MTDAKTKRVGTDLTSGPILKSLLMFAGPLILTNLIQQLYSMTDLIIVGKFVGSTGTVGVSTGGELIDLMTPLATSFAMGGQIYIAQLAGAKDKHRMKEASGTLLSLMMLMSVVCTVLAVVFYKQILQVLNCPDEAFSQAAAYMIITAFGMPMVFGYNAVCSILRGMGESKWPLVFVAIAATVNVFGDLLLVVIIPLDAAGVAISTVLSQLGAFIAAMVFMYKHRDHIGFEFSASYLKIRKTPLKIILRMGIPQLARTISVQGSMLWVKANINVYGLITSATYSVGNKIEKFMNVFIQGVDGAAGAMIGQNLGARKIDRIKKIVKTTICCTMTIGMCVAVLFLTIPRQLFSLFSNDPEVAELGVVFLSIMSIGCLVASFSGCFKSVPTGTGAASLCFVIGVLDGICRIGVCLFFFYVLQQGAQSYFWGAALCQLIPGLISLIYFFSGRWKTKKLLAEA